MKTDWREAAKCAGNTKIEFFPEHGHTGMEAKRFCAGCPVTEECLNYAMKHELDYGVWGGLSAHQRMQIRWKKGR